MISRNKLSILAPNVYRDNNSMCFTYRCHNLYASAILPKIGKSERWGGGVIGMKIQLSHKFEDIISVENLLLAWQEFVRGKRNKPDVQLFASVLIDNILQLHNDLVNKIYKHGGYYQFNISDPKPRNISKASVRDRLVHHAVYRILYPFFDKTFIADSYSCRVGKGTHKAIKRLQRMFYQVSKNNTRTCLVLKLDIKQFFARIDHDVLKEILAGYIPDQDILWLLGNIIDSFGSDCFVAAKTDSVQTVTASSQMRPVSIASARSEATWQSKIGLPLGNLTSQLLVNVYLNEFDQFVKHKLKAKHLFEAVYDKAGLDEERAQRLNEHPEFATRLRKVIDELSAPKPKTLYQHIRYADDFVILFPDRQALTLILDSIRVFLEQKLKLSLHPSKIILKTFASGIDFLGWASFSNHRVLRTKTKKRMLSRINQANLSSYLGLLKHCNGYKLKQMCYNIITL